MSGFHTAGKSFTKVGSPTGQTLVFSASRVFGTPLALVFDGTVDKCRCFGQGNPMRAFSEIIFDWIFRCHLRHLSRVFTIGRQTYQVCLACVTRLRYSW